MRELHESHLPHRFPAIMLEEFAPWSGEGGERGLLGRVRLSDCSLLWATRDGLPAAMGIEILGQLSAVFLREDDSEERLEGGRLAMVDHYQASVAHLPLDEVIEARLEHCGGSSAGYHKFRGEIVSSGDPSRRFLVAEFSVLAFFRS